MPHDFFRFVPLNRRRFLQSAGAGLLASLGVRAEDIDPRVLDAEKQRVAVVDKVKPSVVAIFENNGQGGGSGVLISKDGYCLTNFHVVGAKTGMKCGLPDGVMYNAVLVGLDKVGDVALIKLLPPKEGHEFPFAALGDSDKVKAGDWSLAMGNPFLLATDFTPTVTFGLVSGVHRYQHPEGSGLLEYTDCIQIDTSINPGNSGGPLFNMQGELIGINGRGSFDKRSRINSGVGYAISINQIKNFMGKLRAGLDTDHATLGANVDNDKDDEVGISLVVKNVLDDPPSDVFRRGLKPGDQMMSFGWRDVDNVNAYKNVLGIYPKGWRVPLRYRHDNTKVDCLVRLMGSQETVIELDDMGKPKKPDAQVQVMPPTGPAAKLYKAKAGFANYYFNEQHRDQLLAGFKKHGDFSGVGGEWIIECDATTDKKKTDARFVIREEKAKDAKTGSTVVRLTFDDLKYELEPLKEGQKVRELTQPTDSGGLMMALYHYRELLTHGEKGFVGHFYHGGMEPFYPPPANGPYPKVPGELRVDAEVLITEHADVEGRWFFSPKDYSLLGFEVTVERHDDPCEVFFYDYKPVDGRSFPHRFEVRYGGKRFAIFQVKSAKLANT
jgi:S1-C subfamily serine protease